MNKLKLTYLGALVLFMATVSATAQDPRKLDLLYADETEFIFSKFQDTTYVSGSVIFETESGLVYCDSAMWAKGETVLLWGKVIIDDRDYRLAADSVHYDLISNQAVALGDYVELWSREDSLFAVGQHAFFDRGRDYFYMMKRPTVYLNYPDSVRMIEVIADFVEEIDGAWALTSAADGKTYEVLIVRPVQPGTPLLLYFVTVLV